MIKILRSNLYRLAGSKIFCGVLLANIVLNIIVMLVYSGGNTFNGIPNMDQWFYTAGGGNFVIYGLLGFNLALVSGYLFGVDYSNGTIRNKLINGTKRWELYFANFITTVIIGFIFTVVYYILVFALAYPTLGGLSTRVTAQDIVWNIVCVIFIIFSYASIFTFISMLSRNLTAGLMISIVSVGAAMGIAYLLRDALDEYEFITITETGSYMSDIGDFPNPAYISSPALRKFVEIIISLMPTGQAYELMPGGFNFDGVGASWQFMVSSICVTTIVNTSGYLIFRKLDLK